jgi:hypothetical protein
VSARRNGAPIFVAAGATALLLGLPLADGLPGKVLDVRVFIIGALVLIALAGLAGEHTSQARTLLAGAIASLVATAALVLSDIVATGAILLVIAIGSLLWQRRLWAVAG